jgi:hypothetical protein
MSQWKVNHSLINFASNQIVDALFLIVFFVVAYQYHAYTLITNAIITYAWNWKETRGSQEPVIAHLVFNLTSKVDRKWGSGAALVPNMLAPENLDAITCSYKIVLCQACKFYHSWRQLWSHDTVVLLLVTCQNGKLLCLLRSFLLYWTFCLLWGHFHAENETETSSENNNRKFTYSV